MAIPAALKQALEHFHAKRFDQTIELAKLVLRSNPDDDNASWLLGASLFRSHQPEAARFHLEKAVKARPTDPERRLLYVALLRGQQENELALKQADFLCAHWPRDPRALEAKAGALRQLERMSEAIDYQRRAAALEPTGGARLLLGTELSSMGRHVEAQREVIAGLNTSPPDPRTIGNACFCANAWSQITPEQLFSLHELISKRFAQFAPLELGPLANTPDPERRIRLGYMTGDAKQHSVGYFLDALLRYADHEKFEVFLYRNVKKGDEYTKRFASMADVDRVLTGLDETAAAKLMRSDKIDILVDLSGLTSGSGVWMMRSRVAPVQANYLGYCNTTGVPRVDYRIVDAITDPPGSEHLAVEKLARLPGCFLCYRPHAGLPPVNWAPEPGVLRMTCCNALHKVSVATYDLWSRVLKEVPSSHLTLKTKGLADEGVLAWVREQLTSRGVDPSRFTLMARTKVQEDHLAFYNRMDVALDPFPYNGTTTTCELLCMGVPMVTLRGDRHPARVGASILTCIGAPELIAETPDDYVAIVKRLADDRSALANYRATLSDRTKSSPLCDGPGFMKRLEDLYRGLWREWCAKQPAAANA